MSIRLILRLDVKNDTVVKGIHLEGLRVVGRPLDMAVQYYKAGADEILYMDAVASLYGRNSLLDIVEKTSRAVFVPMTVGGGIRSIEDIGALLRAGADKIAINTAAVKRPEFITEASDRFGAQCIVLSIEAKRVAGGWEAYVETGREATGVDVLEWASRAVALGAGEILLTSIDHEGVRKGYDLELTAAVSRAVDVPVIACGGAGMPEHVADALTEGKADAVAFASILHYQAHTLAQIRGHLSARSMSVRCLA